MLPLIRLCCIGVCFVLPLCAFETEKSSTFRQERMLGDLDFIKNTFLTNYAPIDWKKKHSGWDLETEIQAAKDQVIFSDSFSTKDVQKVLKNFFNSVKDYHVNVNFYSTEMSYLPFYVRHAQGKYFISYVDPPYDDQDDFPFEIGDELVLIDGIPTSQVVDEFISKELGSNRPETDKALAEIYLTTRLGSLGHDVPEGEVTLTGRKKGEEELLDYTVAWRYSSEKIAGALKVVAKKMMRRAAVAIKPQKAVAKPHDFFQKQFVLPQYKALNAIRAEDNGFEGILGAKKSYLPHLGQVIWESPESIQFHTYLFELPNGKIAGYIRIPTYDVEDVELAALEFAELIGIFQREADVLVIDQLNNPGGLVLYMYAMASMLTDRPLIVPQQRQMLTQEDVYFAVKEHDLYDSIESDKDARELIGYSLEGMEVTQEIGAYLSNYLRFVVNEWNEGRQFTQPGYLYGIGPLLPHSRVNFTKPILMLVNSLDFSCGDFFPAILQDNRRAVIMGTQTAGAGGYVLSTTFPNLSGIKSFSFTGSIALRPGNKIIENHGITPDIIYELSHVDLQNEYVEYRHKIVETLEKISTFWPQNNRDEMLDAVSEEFKNIGEPE